jgi:ribonucleoside-triphosphate reductase
MKQEVQKRDGRIVRFNREKIADAIFKAANACGGTDRNMAEDLADKVVALIEAEYKDRIPHVEEIQNLVEKVLVEEGHYRTVKAYILYREKRQKARDMEALVNDTNKMFNDYLGDKDWVTKENANMQKSVNGLNNYVREAFTKRYWLYEIYPKEVRDAHVNGDIHIHDLGFFGPYCTGWD